MDSVNALELRQSLGRVIARLRRTGRPLLLKKGKEPVAVLIRIEDYEERFADREAAERRRELLRGMDALARRSVEPRAGAEILRELRDGS
jgi:PHD/YefM family antitoxin component YafN of YafNO toxin-antitoxin module